MYHFTGFVNIGPLIDNTVSTVSPIGELSENSRTFCKEKGYFTNASAPNVELVAMAVRDSGTGNLTQIDQPWADRLIEISDWIYSQAAIGQLGNTGSLIAQNINIQFGSEIDQLSVGTPVSNGSVVLPSSIGFRFLDVVEENSVKLWFADAYIRSEYPEVDIVWIPPVNSLDALFGSRASVEAAIASFSRAALTQRINEIQEQYPSTHVGGDEYNEVFSGGLAPLLTTWTYVGYGPLAANPDIRKQSLINYILENSSYDLEDWTERFPSLFISTEFVIVPHWDVNSIPNADISSSWYSPMLTPNMGLGYLNNLDLGYGAAWIESTYRMFGVTYKSLAVTAVGNPQNVDLETIINDKFYDYINVSPQNSPGDFGKMRDKTKRFANLLNNLLPVAEVMTPISIVPAGMVRITRGDWTYLAASVDNVLYLVLPRYELV